MASVFYGITTKDVLAVLVVGATLIFNGISLVTGNPLDPTTVGLSGVIIGHYFRPSTEVVVARREDPLPAPYTGKDEPE